MQVKNYANKYQIPVSDVIETLSGKFNKTVWQPSSDLKVSHITLLNSVFGNVQLQLPAPKEALQLSESKENPETSNSTELATTEKTELAQKIREQKELLATEEIQTLRTGVKTTVIKESAQIAAITDYQTYQDTYEETTRELVINEVFSHLERQSSIREQFKSSQMLRQETQAKPESKDLTTELLELWGDDHNDFVNNLLKNIK
ncbi:hypothetical protein [Nostoc commune]|uniref:hypothetical protein n=1 Tax=Nostoc commune TaxID=1178 RepID=UPI0018C72B19|nr:hypothetical protein [Nostoc commune]MBG1262878.1 hypothetical protein [Nostoc commune BAE]